MTKNYTRGADYKLYLDTASNFSSPTWVVIKGVGDVSVDFDQADVEVPERGMDTGHLNGEKNPSFKFTLFEDTGDSNVETLIAAMFAGTMKHLAVSRSDITTTGTKYFHMECVLNKSSMSANRGDPSSWDVTALRHANSDNPLTRGTAS